jgi:hypothetical protein
VGVLFEVGDGLPSLGEEVTGGTFPGDEEGVGDPVGVETGTLASAAVPPPGCGALATFTAIC